MTLPTREQIAEAFAADRQRALGEVCRLTGLPVVAVVRVPLRPDQPRGPEGFFLRLDDGGGLVLPVALDRRTAERILGPPPCPPGRVDRWTRSLRHRLREASTPSPGSALSAGPPGGGSRDTPTPPAAPERGL